jgi:hypothetical protein
MDSLRSAAAIPAGLIAIVCIGETKTKRDDGCALPILRLQIERSIPPHADSAEIVVANEPISAIGAGITPTLRDVAEAMLSFALISIRSCRGGVYDAHPLWAIRYVFECSRIDSGWERQRSVRRRCQPYLLGFMVIAAVYN